MNKKILRLTCAIAMIALLATYSCTIGGGLSMASITSVTNGESMLTTKGKLNTNFTNINNEVIADTTAIGTLASLTTTAKTSTVVAINELVTKKQRVSRYVIGTSVSPYSWTVADCSYLCDGTNDEAQINSAITALPANGGEIIILDGIYSIGAKITVTKSNVVIRGNGVSTQLKRAYNSGAFEGIINIETGLTNIKISDLSINGFKGTYASGNNCGIKAETGCANCIIEKINTYDNSYGIYILGGTRFNILNNTVETGANAGILVTGGSLHLIKGNYSNNNTGGIELSETNYCEATANSCYQNSIGILIFNTTKSNVSNNYLIRGTGTGGDYSGSQYTIFINSNANYNLITSNMIMGKNYSDSGTGNTLANNKYS